MIKYLFIFMALIFWNQLGYAQDETDNKLNHLIDKYYPNQEDPGIMLYISDNQGKMQYSKYKGMANLDAGENITSKTNFRMASVSKQVTAHAIYQLLKGNKIDFYQKISDFFPNLKGKARDINVYYLLNHVSGIVDYEEILPENQKNQLSDHDVLQLIEAVDSTNFQMGTKFRYSNTGYCLLSLIVEKASGKDFSRYVKEEMFDKWEMRNSLVYKPSDKILNRAYGYHLKEDQFVYADQSITSATQGDGGVYTSGEDFAKLNAGMNFDMGVWGPTVGYGVYFENNLCPINKDISYSFGKFFGKDQNGNNAFFHSGESTGFNNIVISIPQRDLCISLFSNRDDLQIDSFFEEILKLMDIQIQGLGDKTLFAWLSDVYAHNN